VALEASAGASALELATSLDLVVGSVGVVEELPRRRRPTIAHRCSSIHRSGKASWAAAQGGRWTSSGRACTTSERGG
jgi:hypothetical protein